MADAPQASIRDLLSKSATSEVEEEAASSVTSQEPAKPDPSPEGGFSKYEQQLLSGIQTEGWTEGQKKEWATARKSYDKGWHGSQAEYAEAKRFVDELKSAGFTQEQVRAALSAKQGNGQPQTEVKPPLTPDQRQALKGIDRLIDQTTDPAIREQLRESKQTIIEEAERVADDRITQRLKPIEEEMTRLKGVASGYRHQEASAEIDALEDELGYPASLVEKHRDTLLRVALQYPQASLEDILFKVVPAKELRSVIGAAPLQEKARPRAAGMKPASVSSTPETSAADESEFKMRKGGINIEKMMRSVLDKVTQ